jgi:hypothetical protein
VNDDEDVGVANELVQQMGDIISEQRSKAVILALAAVWHLWLSRAAMRLLT